jgi:hypothetical protein
MICMKSVFAVCTAQYSDSIDQYAIINNVFERHFARYRHFDRLDLSLSSTITATVRATTSFSYYLMCLRARFYDYLAPSEVCKKLSSKLIHLDLLRSSLLQV